MTGKPTSPSEPPGSGRQSGLLLAFLLVVMVPLILLVPLTRDDSATQPAGCPALYQRLGQLLSSLPLDSGRQAGVRHW